jgi:hypothetical protein
MCLVGRINRYSAFLGFSHTPLLLIDQSSTAIHSQQTQGFLILYKLAVATFLPKKVLFFTCKRNLVKFKKSEKGFGLNLARLV